MDLKQGRAASKRRIWGEALERRDASILHSGGSMGISMGVEIVTKNTRVCSYSS